MSYQHSLEPLWEMDKLLTATSEYGPSCSFYTDGSLIEGCVGFAVHQMWVGGFGHKIQSPAGIFTVELSALFTALRHIAEVKRPPERCLILNVSMSSIKAMLSRKITHQTQPLVVYECKQLWWSLCQNWIEVKLMWIPSHVGLVGNELVDEWARQAALEDSIFDRTLSTSDFQSLARPALMRARQAKWFSADTGRFAHVTIRPWFEGQKEERGLYALCQGFYLDIALFNCVLVDFELLMIWCLCVCVQVIMRQ
jgi:ribonuclease HI